jgi:hypothetical protein
MTSRRQKERSHRERIFWRDKDAAAGTPVERAAVAWDRLRARVNQLPHAHRGDVWQGIANELDALSSDLQSATDSEVHNSHSQQGSPRFRVPRPDARQRARG